MCSTSPVQSDGGQNFDRPVPACFPNVPNRDGFTLLPGALAVLMSFNHDTGKWETSGGMTVSADGKLVCTDPGVGIRQPGWHGFQGPPPIVPPPPPPVLTTDPPVNPCSTRTDANCKEACTSTSKGEQLDCDKTAQAKFDSCLANGNLSGAGRSQGGMHPESARQ